MPEKQFLNRIRQGLRPDSTSLVTFIKENTYLNMRPFSFYGHEFQQYIVELIEKDPNIDLSCEKCSQMGISEIFFRVVMALMALTPGYSIIYAMPTAKFSQEVLRTRISPIISGSPALRALISKDVDSASVKMFTNSAILYALGASGMSSGSLINRPVQLVLTDEIDRCDQDVVTGFRSRQTHSLNKPRICFSTPTAPGFGVNAEADGRQLHYQIIVCVHCKHEFIPDYYTQVELPGFNYPISTLTAEVVREKNLNIDAAFHFCPKCHGVVDTSPETRKWVIEDSHLRKIHVRLSPFAAPHFIKIPDLVTSQLTYTSRSEFDNQALGLPSQLSAASIDQMSIKFTHDEPPSGLPVAGMDLGKTSYFMKGILSASGVIFIDHVELIQVGDLERIVDVNIATMNIISMVADALPFLDVIHRLARKHAQFWGATYATPLNPEPELYKLKMNAEESVRQIRIQRDMFFDHLAGLLVTEQVVFKSGQYDQMIINHITDMRRVRDHRFSDVRYKWVKSMKGVDHAFHTLGYLVAASKIIQKSSASLPMNINNLIHSFRNKADL